MLIKHQPKTHGDPQAPSLIAGVRIEKWQQRYDEVVAKIQDSMRRATPLAFQGEPFIDFTPRQGLHIFGYVVQRGLQYNGTSARWVSGITEIGGRGKPYWEEHTDLPEVDPNWIQAVERALRTLGLPELIENIGVWCNAPRLP